MYRSDSLVIRNKVDARISAQKEMFLNILERVYNVSVAIKVSGLSRDSVYRWKREDKDFSDKWDHAIEIASGSLESAAYLKLAKVYTDDRKRLSMPEERLTEFLLTGMYPDKYRQKVTEPDIQITINWAIIPDDVLTAFNNGKLTLDDVYAIQLTYNDETAERSEASSTERASEERSD